MPEYVVDRAMKILNHNKKAMNGAKVLVLGVAYKSDIDDYRESPALNVMDYLISPRCQAQFTNPYITGIVIKGMSHQGRQSLRNRSVRADIVINSCTAYACFDYDYIQKHAKEIFDTRNATKKLADKSNIELL